MTLVVLPTAAEREDDRVLEVAFAPELLDEAPLPIGLPITFTLGLETDCDCDPDAVLVQDVVVLLCRGQQASCLAQLGRREGIGQTQIRQELLNAAPRMRLDIQLLRNRGELI